MEPGFGTGEWGFAIGSPFWGTGVFQEVNGEYLDQVLYGIIDEDWRSSREMARPIHAPRIH